MPKKQGDINMARIFSLCQTVNHTVKNEPILYRLADIDEFEKKLCEFKNSSQQYSSENKVYKRPYTSPVNHQMNELKIWEWDPYTKVWAERTQKSFYELSMSNELMLEDKNDIIRKLKTGFKASEYYGQKLFVKIQEDEDYFYVLAIDSSKVKIVNDFIKINENTHMLKGYNLLKSDFINTGTIASSSSDGTPLPSRYIYIYLELQEPDFEFELVTFAEKLTRWLNKQLKLKGLSRKETKSSKELFLDALDNYGEIKAFFEENEFNSENLDLKIAEVKLQIEEVLSENNQYDIFAERMIETLPVLTEKFKKIVERNWFEEHKIECEKAKQELLLLTQSRDELSEECRGAKESVEILQAKQLSLKNEIDQLTSLQSNLNASLTSKIVDIKSNISEFFAETILYQSLLGVDKGTTKFPVVETAKVLQQNQLIQIFSEHLEGTVEEINSITDMLYFLGKNIATAGVYDDINSCLSQYITACMTHKRPILLVGYGARNIADAISATICGKTADVIILTSDYKDNGALYNMILSCESEVILIENAIGSVDEQVYMQLIKGTSNKTILFSIEFAEQLNFIPKSILNYINLLCLDEICGRKKQEEYTATVLNSNILIVVDDSKGLRANQYAANEISRLIGMPRIYNLFRAELLTTMNSYCKPSAMFSWFIFEVAPYLGSVGQSQDALELLSIKGLSEEEIKKLRLTINSDEK